MTAQDILQKLAQEHGQLTPEIVIDYAKPKQSPLHQFFQWDDSKAAEMYRLDQARGLIRRIKVEYVTEETKTVTVRAYHCVMPDIPTTSNDGEDQPNRGVYVPIETAMSDYRTQLMAQCRRDMESFKRKYAALKEVATVIDAMDAVA